MNSKDDLDAARGIIYGLAISAVFWIIVGVSIGRLL